MKKTANAMAANKNATDYADCTEMKISVLGVMK
jgi:hypothetical protein